MRVIAGLFALSWLMVSACAPSYNVFPSKVRENIDPSFDFSSWHMTPDGSGSKKVQVGGRIVQSQASDGRVTVVVAQLPLVQHPAYGPKDNGKQNGEFVFTYQGTVEPANLQPGNRVVVVGMTRPWKVVTINDLSRSYPMVEAQCLHFWNTQGRDIEDFPFYESGYVTLRQETVCAKN